MSLDDSLMTYVHEEVGDFNPKGSYLIFSDEVIEYEGKNLVVIERMHKITEISSTLVLGFLEETVESADGEKTSYVKPVISDERKNVQIFLRENGFAQEGDVYFFNNEIVAGRTKERSNVIYDPDEIKPELPPR